MNIEMNLNSEPFNQIKCGLKTIELRVNDDKRRNIRINDIIEFTCTADKTQKLICRVTNLYYFKNFEELYAQLPLDKCGYTRSGALTAKTSDMNKYYSAEKICKFGVVGIELQLI